ncbi:MAG: hypothetical protein KAG97_00530, partial [Victivallales bacterium]|nr:hypothetical protein [Victivallales bacterium]
MDVFLDSLSVGVPIALVAVAIFAAAALSVGWLCARFVLKASFRHSLPALVICFTLGLNIIAVFALIAGVLGAIRPAFIWTAMVSAILAALYLSRELRGSSFNANLATFITNQRSLIIVISLIFLAGLGSSLCYPFGWDELTYHIAVPMRWLNDGSLNVYPDNPYSGFPSLVEILFRTGMGMGGVLFPRLLNLSVCVAMLLAMWTLLRRYA